MKLIQLILFTSATLVYSLSSFALSTDRDQPANIEADDIEFDFKKGTRIYNKNVLIVQGTLQIKADKLVTNYDDGELSLATATGAPAQFKQRPDDKPDDVEGSAQRIVVDQKNNILTLYGQASLTQGPDTARGETIIYNMATDTLKVQGGAKVKTAGADGQTAPDLTEDPFAPKPIQASTEPEIQTPPSSDIKADDAPPAESEADAKVEEKTVVVPETLPVGRSRLIIQPK